MQVEADTVDRLDMAHDALQRSFLDREVLLQIADRQQRAACGGTPAVGHWSGSGHDVLRSNDGGSTAVSGA